MIVVTGGAGFIGSAFVWRLNRAGIKDIVIVDRLGNGEKWKNLVKLRYRDFYHKDAFLRLVKEDAVPFSVEAVVHLGACSNTMERDADYLWENNVRYSQYLARWALKRDIRFIYASSAATYGDGSRGFSDDDETTRLLKPINMYGYSKQAFDLWILDHDLSRLVVGIKFFNVFGPNEYHKGEMRSVVHKAVGQVLAEGKVRLFRSYRPEYEDGGQKRDFIYVKDCVDVLWWLLQHPEVTGIYNLGTGRARTWNDLVYAIFSALQREPVIEYIDMPPGLERQYQYFTEARMEKLQGTGCPLSFSSLEEAVSDYVQGYLTSDDPYLGGENTRQ
ncbi:MAG TPA: ADP-glyceromanno-heptose 6-epimerase [Syntrophales bacterium]|nr:ADP-glyceromanno-heptose 6-epimerase [Syntrophales bacterium]HOL58383.1 ADP-glyceromanno-heptose 6-epimerase [Syntrophales bacterium]HPO34552.1 ADP-glyceromanno-heptose 6-epimerase [Syntrophales bacterium]